MLLKDHRALEVKYFVEDLVCESMVVVTLESVHSRHYCLDFHCHLPFQDWQDQSEALLLECFGSFAKVELAMSIVNFLKMELDWGHLQDLGGPMASS